MPSLATYSQRPVILLTNDDGPPCSSSPNIYAFCKLLIDRLGWEVRVVIPDCQKSWVGKAYAISEIITASYFYPLEPDGLSGEITTHSRPLKAGESMEWILLSGTPATCTNIALHNIYPGEIDLIISGPNHGRNSSTAFALSSGTIGAALAGALSVPIPGPSNSASLHVDHIPSIAVSYGVVTRPVSARTFELAHEVAVDVCKRLFDDWGFEDERRPVQVYSVNIPLVEKTIERGCRRVCWTTMWRNTYGRLFKATEFATTKYDPGDDPKQKPVAIVPNTGSDDRLKFQFAPDMNPLLFPDLATLPEGTDAWAFANGFVSVTPIRAEYGGLSDSGRGFGSVPKAVFWV